MAMAARCLAPPHCSVRGEAVDAAASPAPARPAPAALSFLPAMSRKAMASAALAAYLVACPCGTAEAGPIPMPYRQAEVVMSTGSGNSVLKVVDKVFTTVVSGQTVVSPELLEKDLKAFISGDQELQEEWRREAFGRLRNLANSVLDFNPFHFFQTAEGLVEAGAAAAEQFAAYELSALVALGERWFVFTPLVAIPMAFEMRRRQRDGERGREAAAEALSLEAAAKAELVRRELQRIAIKADVVNLVESLGDMALRPAERPGARVRKQIRDLVQQLAELGDGGRAGSDVAGDWLLIYVSEAEVARDQQDVPRIAGVEVRNIRQMVSSSPSSSSSSVLNSAEVSLGPLGVVRVAIQGRWEALQDGRESVVSFQQCEIVPTEILGNALPGWPPVRIALPRELQQSAQWELLYVDDSLRVNRGGQGQLYVFQEVGINALAPL